MYYIQKDLYNLKENDIPSLAYNEDDFIKWLVNINWQYKEQQYADLWFMGCSSITPFYGTLQILMHIYGIDINKFEEITKSFTRERIEELEEKYEKEYDMETDSDMHIDCSEIFAYYNFTTLFSLFIKDYMSGGIAKLKICKDCGKIFFENENYWTSRGLCVPKRCLDCREKRRAANRATA